MPSLAQLQSIDGIGPKRYEKICNSLRQEKMSIERFLKLEATEIKARFGLPINVARNIHEFGSQLTTEVQEKPLDSTIKFTDNIITLTKDDSRYPKRLLQQLGDRAPEKIYAWGNLGLLNHPGIGFCGSRNVSVTGLEATKDIAEQIAGQDWIVISGHARGVDTTAHKAALVQDAGTIIVLPQGIDTFKLRAELKAVAKKKNLLVISEFPRKAGWNAGYAMQRNKTIIALSNAMMLIESRLEGGTFSAGKSALQMKHPLFVVEYETTEENNKGKREIKGN